MEILDDRSTVGSEWTTRLGVPIAKQKLIIRQSRNREHPKAVVLTNRTALRGAIELRWQDLPVNSSNDLTAHQGLYQCLSCHPHLRHINAKSLLDNFNPAYGLLSAVPRYAVPASRITNRIRSVNAGPIIGNANPTRDC